MTEAPFGDVDDFIALPRVSGLAVSPDGSRVVTTVSELNDKRTEYVTAFLGRHVLGDDIGCPRRSGSVDLHERIAA